MEDSKGLISFEQGYLIAIGVFIIWIGLLLKNASVFPLLAALVGALISLIRRSRLRNRTGEKRLIDILLNDYYFEHYATLSIISFVYGVAQGALIGGALGFSLVTLIGMVFVGSELVSIEYFLSGSLGCLILLFLLRVFLEGYTILYRTAQDFSSYVRDKKG